MNIDIHHLLPLSAESLLGESVAVLGIKGSGKSNTAAVLVEELLAARVPVCVLDIAGEYHGLKTEYDNLYVIGCSLNPATLDATIRSPDRAADAAERSYRRGVPVVLDLSGFDSGHRLEFVAAYLRRIWELSLTLRHPYTIVMEEAHNYVPQRGHTVVKKIATDIAAEGRKRGLGIVMVGQRSSRIDKDVLTQAGILFLHRVIHSADLRIYAELIPRPPSKVKHAAQKLKTGEALVLSGELYRRCLIRLRHTPHYGYTPTMDDLPTERGVDDVADLVGTQFKMTLDDGSSSDEDDNAFRSYYENGRVMNWQQRIDRARADGGFTREDRRAGASWLTSPTCRVDCPRMAKGQLFDSAQPKGFRAVGVEPHTRLRTLDVEFGVAVNDNEIEKAQQLLSEIATVAQSLGYGQAIRNRY